MSSATKSSIMIEKSALDNFYAISLIVEYYNIEELMSALDISHRDIIKEKLGLLTSPFSEFSFMNLYLFREIHKYEVIESAEGLYISGFTRDSKKYLMPLFKIDVSSVDAVCAQITSGMMIFPVDSETVPLFTAKGFSAEYNPADSDYIFSIEKLATYPGRHLHKKRNLMKQFLELYSWSMEDITADNREACLAILETWQKDTGLSEQETDVLSCREALLHFEDFGLSGTLFYAGEETAGFTLGEFIAGKTYALHFAKGLTRFKGIYQFMYNVFAKELCKDCLWINFEQDLGIPALRQAKESYMPDRMEHKYRISKSGEAISVDN